MWQDPEKSEEGEVVGGGDPDDEPDGAGADGGDVEEQLDGATAAWSRADQGVHGWSYSKHCPSTTISTIAIINTIQASSFTGA